MKVEYEPVYDECCRLVLLDIYVDGVWHGSRRTFAQCQEYVRQL